MAASLVAVIDYGSGNLRSAERALIRASSESGAAAEVRVTADPETVRRAERIVLPGVGAFADCMAGLSGIPGMIGAIEEAVRRASRPFLGICVGMQLLATEGHEQTEGERAEYGRHHQNGHRPAQVGRQSKGRPGQGGRL